MKNTRHLMIIACVTAGLASSIAMAAPRAGENDSTKYLVAARDLGAWHIGGYYRHMSREIEWNGTKDATVYQGLFFVGRDVLPWMTAYALLGAGQMDFDDMDAGESGGGVFGGGAWFNFLEHELLDYSLLEHRIRISGMAQYTFSSSEAGGEDLSWGEFYADLTLGVTSDIVGNKSLWPEGITLFAGPVYNSLQTNDFDSDTAGLGITAGLDVHISQRNTISVGYELYNEDEGITASLGIRF